MRAEVRPRRAALPPHPRLPRRGRRPRSRGALRAAAGAEGAAQKPRHRAVRGSRAGAPSARREESRSRGAGTPERAPERLRTQPSPRGPHLRGSDVAPAPPPLAPGPVLRVASLFSPGGASPPPRPPASCRDSAQTSCRAPGGPCQGRGGGSGELCGGYGGVCAAGRARSAGLRARVCAHALRSKSALSKYPPYHGGNPLRDAEPSRPPG